MIDFNKIHPEAPIYGGDDRIDKLTNKVETGSKFNVGEMNVIIKMISHVIVVV